MYARNKISTNTNMTTKYNTDSFNIKKLLKASKGEILYKLYNKNTESPLIFLDEMANCRSKHVMTFLASILYVPECGGDISYIQLPNFLSL